MLAIIGLLFGVAIIGKFTQIEVFIFGGQRRERRDGGEGEERGLRKGAEREDRDREKRDKRELS